MTGAVLAKPAPQPGVKPLPSTGTPQMTISWHEGRLVIHSFSPLIANTFKLLKMEKVLNLCPSLRDAETLVREATV